MMDASSNRVLVERIASEYEQMIEDAWIEGSPALDSPPNGQDIAEMVLRVLADVIPNRVQPGTFGPVFDAGVEEGKRQARHATPNRVRSAADAAQDDQAALFAVMRAAHNHHSWIKTPHGPAVLVEEIDAAYHGALLAQDTMRGRS